jgi:hypothetical protein
VIESLRIIPLTQVSWKSLLIQEVSRGVFSFGVLLVEELGGFGELVGELGGFGELVGELV